MTSASGSSGASGRGRISGRETEKLETWKPEKLPALHTHPGCQDFRISDFHPPMAAPRIWLGGPGRGSVNGRFALKPGPSVLAYINNGLRTGNDPTTTFSVSICMS